MPITVQQPLPPVLGPGLLLNVHSDLGGPIPLDWSWRIFIRRQGEEQPSITLTGPLRTDIQNTAFVIIGQEQAGWSQTISTTVGLADQTPVNVQVELIDTVGTRHDEGVSTDYVWDSTTNLWTLQGQVSGGFTDSDRQLLTQTSARSELLGEPGSLIIDQPSGPIETTLATLFSRRTLDQLTLSEITSGETCEPVRATVAVAYLGVIVRVTTIDPELHPKTPDDQWYFPDLAVLRVFRGGDLQFRRGIHTPTFFTEQPWQWGWPVLNTLPVLGVPPDVTIAVDWRTGCCGQVFLSFLP